MSTPPNPPSTPAGPPTGPADTPTPETDSIPAPAQPLSLEKTPEAPAAPETPAAPAPATPEPVRPPSAFAPPTPPAPTPAGAPGYGTPAPQSHQWGAPTPAFPGAPYPGYAQPAPTGNGLAVAAVITGGFGIVLGVIPFLFWAGTLVAAVGVGLGIGGVVRANKGAPNKSMAVVGTVLAVLGLLSSVGGFFLTFLVVDRAESRADRQVEEHLGRDGRRPGKEPRPSTPPSPTQVPGLTSALPFGETFTYSNGIKVSLSVPTAYEPKSKYSRERIKNAVQLTVTITNGSTEPHDVIFAVPNVRDDQGMTADIVYDGGQVPKMLSGSVLPGESASGIMAFEVPEGTRSISADITAGIMFDRVKYAGPIG
ncbi:hypothetical protein [Streptomyces venezuelae]|uniref:hypothetical protein n=1 Tax=Streptomyces venezuelae TaxID=54571 RepID=UPI003330C6F9